MKKLLITGCALLTAFAAVAMPNKKELNEAKIRVEKATASDMQAVKNGTLTLKDCADKHMELAKETGNQAEKYLLYQGAFNLYARGGESDLASDALRELCNEVGGVSTDVIIEIVNKAMRYAPDIKAPDMNASGLYCVIDLSGGAKAKAYPVAYLDKEPKGGFNKPEYKTTKLVLKRVAAGSFVMGEDQKDKSHRVTLTKPFYMGLFETTQKQWELVMGTNPCTDLKFGFGNEYPVYYVSYTMVRGEKAGVKWPASNAVDETSFLGKLRAKTRIDFDLPTAAQWEFTCRAGTRTAYGFGDNADDGYMWFNKNAGGKAHAVGMKKPNKWGFYDMHGNIYEWALDWFGAATYGADPKGPAAAKDAKRLDRTFCGGSWAYDATDSTSFFRSNCSQNFAGSNNGGFRLCGPAK